MKKQSASAKHSAASSPAQATNVIIETPKGSRNKYAFDPQTGHFKLSKILPEGMVFPYDFGFVPFTRAADGDPIDVLVLIEETTFPGCQLECNLVGVIEAEQRELNGRRNRNDRLIGVARASLVYANIGNINELNPAVVDQIEAFFVNYQKLRNVQVEVIGRCGPERAYEILQQAGYGKHAA